MSTESHHAGCCTPHPVHAERAQLDDLAPADRTATARHHGKGPAAADAKADLLLTGSLLTMDEANPRAEAVAVSGGRIVGVGSRSDLEGLVGPSTQLVEAEGTVMPGLVEPHMHLFTSGITWGTVDCSPTANATFDDVVARLKAAVPSVPAGSALVGQLFDPSLFPGMPVLTADILDQVSTDVPVMVMNASQHFFYVNSAAYAAVGVDASTPDPAGGSYGAKDGRLTGVVAEAGAMVPFIKLLPPMTKETLVAALTGIANEAAKVGTTKLHEAATGALLGAAEVDLLHATAAQPGFPVRITAAVWGLRLDDMTKAGITVGSGDDMVRTEFVKWVADGSNQGFTGYMREPYLNSDSRGAANYTVDELVTNFTASLEAGWPLMMHGNGDAGIDNILEALAQVSKLPVWDASLRHRIEHCSVLHDEQIAQMAALGVNPSFLMNHVRLWGRAFRDEILGAERANKLDRVRSAQAAGLRPSLHCDYSVSPMNPLDYVCTAVTRTMADGGEVLNPDERISVQDALKGITTDAAWMCRSDDLCGSIEVGKAADFTVLAADPTAVEAEAIREIEVRQTWLDGEVRFSA